jgi:hypothetical protein
MRGNHVCRGAFAVLIALCGPATPSAAQDAALHFGDVQDTVSNPIRMGCGERVDPVGYILFMAADLALTPAQTDALEEVRKTTRDRNLPLAALWRGTHAPESLAGLRESYRDAVSLIETILTSEQWQAAEAPIFEPTQKGDVPPRGTVRCFFRSHLVVVR